MLASFLDTCAEVQSRTSCNAVPRLQEEKTSETYADQRFRCICMSRSMRGSIGNFSFQLLPYRLYFPLLQGQKFANFPVSYSIPTEKTLSSKADLPCE